MFPPGRVSTRIFDRLPADVEPVTEAVLRQYRYRAESLKFSEDLPDEPG
jgi:hypothetical protein